MTWNIRGTYYAPCSCNVGCPCALGEPDGDQGWCSGILCFDIGTGTVDGVDVGSTKVTFIGDWPRGFLSGGGTGKLFFDTGISDQKQKALEPVLTGQKGGVFEVLSSLVDKVLPSETAAITINVGKDETTLTVGDAGNGVVRPLVGPSGERTRLLHAAAAFRDDITLANGRGSRFAPKGMRAWESGGHAEQADFDWSG